jgi:hypothetical protein
MGYFIFILKPVDEQMNITQRASGSSNQIMADDQIGFHDVFPQAGGYEPKSLIKLQTIATSLFAIKVEVKRK